MSRQTADWSSRYVGLRRRLPGVDPTTIGTLLTAVGGQAALIVSGVLLARSLGPQGRGELAFLAALATSAAHIVSMGLPVALAYQAATQPSSLRASLRALVTPGWIQGLLLLIVPLIVMACRRPEDEVLLASLAMLPAGLALLAMQYALGLLQGLQRFAAFNLLRLAPTVAYALAVLAVASLGIGSVFTFALVFSAANVAGAVMIVRQARYRLPPSSGPDPQPRTLLAYGARAQIGHASPLENFQLDQLVVRAMAGPAVLGLYVVAMAFTNLPRFIAQSVGMVAFPRVAARLAGGSGASREAVDLLVLTTICVAACAVPLALTMHRLVPFFFGTAFEASIPAARLLLVAACLMSLKRVLGDILRGAGAPLQTSVAELLSWVAYGVAATLLIPRSGLFGAAMALVVATATNLAGLTFAALRLRHTRRRNAELPRG